MAGSFDSTLGSDPEHQDHPHQWLAVSILHGAVSELLQGGTAIDHDRFSRSITMGNLFIEAKPKGRPEGSGTEDSVVETYADHALATFKTQYDAIEWAKKNGYRTLTPLI
jgi:hypothetical protein